MRNETVLKLNLCGADFPTLQYSEIHGRIYFDCLRSPIVENDIERHRKSFHDFDTETVIYDAIGLNFSKSFLYKDKIVDRPVFLYSYNSVTSNGDWCKWQL